jgi:hypothetical protein
LVPSPPSSPSYIRYAFTTPQRPIFSSGDGNGNGNGTMVANVMEFGSTIGLFLIMEPSKLKSIDYYKTRAYDCGVQKAKQMKKS